jgi:hypothetical protein
MPVWLQIVVGLAVGVAVIGLILSLVMRAEQRSQRRKPRRKGGYAEGPTPAGDAQLPSYDGSPSDGHSS